MGKKSIEAVFSPRSICVVGASSSSGKTGNFAMRAAAACGVPMYPINPSGVEEIMGHKVYAKIEDIPDDNVDLFLFVIPVKAMKESLLSAIKKGCRAAVIYSAGFKEAGEDGAALEKEMRDIANEAGVRIIGPNTLGYLRAATRLNATFEPQYSDLFKEQGKITLLCQSGGVGVVSLSAMMDQGVPLGTFIALGNRMNTEFSDMLEFFADDEETDVVCMHVEGTEDVRAMYEAARRCAARKPVIVVGGGYTEAGGKSARSHTGTMASSAKIYQAAYQQAGVLQVSSINEMINAAKLLSIAPPPKGDRVAVLTHLAGPSVLTCDKLELGGVKLAELSEETKTALEERRVVPEFGAPVNPIDLAAYGKTKPELFVRGAEVLVKDPGVDGLIAVSASALADKYAPQFPIEDFGKVFKDARMPAAIVWGAYYTDYHNEFKRFFDAGVAAYPTPEEAGIAYANFVNYYKLRDRDMGASEASDFDGGLKKYIGELADQNADFLMEHESKQIMELAGIKTSKTVLAATGTEAASAARDIGYPVVLKVAAENIIHKSDMGGVKLNLKDADDVMSAFHEIREKALKIPDSGFKGVTVQPMLEPGGTEIIIGAMHDPQAGPVVMAGLGGVFVEVLKDISFRLAPVTRSEAKEMLDELKGAALLRGVRGGNAVNEDTLAELIVRVSQLISEFPITEIDLNPVICYGGEKYYAVDARVILKD